MQKETRVMILLRKDSLHNAWDMRNQNLLEKKPKNWQLTKKLLPQNPDTTVRVPEVYQFFGFLTQF